MHGRFTIIPPTPTTPIIQTTRIPLIPTIPNPTRSPTVAPTRTAFVRATATMVAHTGLATPNIPQGHPAFVGNPAAVGFHATPQGHDQKVTAVGRARCSLFVRTI